MIGEAVHISCNANYTSLGFHSFCIVVSYLEEQNEPYCGNCKTRLNKVKKENVCCQSENH